jgi:hypothetical protein
MIKRKEGMSVKEDREYLTAENNAYDNLLEHGYTPSGMTRDFKKVVVFKIRNAHERNGKDVFYFDNWQEAMETLCGQD